MSDSEEKNRILYTWEMFWPLWSVCIKSTLLNKIHPEFKEFVTWKQM